ncbi:MAG TPA: hypothetical protein VG713_14290 [Pirellulales bacterium]|nr:hypothetical protein [Pirellulales bacterium]
MSLTRSFSDDEIDAFVLRHLEQQAESFDPRPLLARIQRDVTENDATLLRESGVEDSAKSNGLKTTAITFGRFGRLANSRALRRFAYAAASLATIVLMAVVWRSTEQESAAAVVRETRLIHALPVDRCYLVEVQRRGYAGADILPVNRVDRLWTRGDQFFLESTNAEHRWAWGRDETGSYWTTYGRRAGFKLEPDEIPGWLETSCDILSMRLETMLDEVLRDFTLTWDHDASHPGLKVVHASDNRGRRLPWLKEARLEIDSETKVLRKAIVFRRDKQGQIVTVTYTLAGMEAQPDGSYQLESRLEQPAEIYTRTNKPEKRIEIVTKLFGREAARQLRGLNPQPVASPK